jgi:hypothetical protein
MKSKMKSVLDAVLEQGSLFHLDDQPIKRSIENVDSSGYMEPIDFYFENLTQSGTAEQTLEIDFGGKIGRLRARATTTGQTTPTPEYIASVRRRKCKKLAALIQSLDEYATDSMFSAFTSEILDEIRHLITFLADADYARENQFEGNCREVLRQIRDSLMNLGWEKYRAAGVRQLVKSICDGLATADHVTADYAATVYKRLDAAELTPCLFPVDVPFDGEEEAEIPD